MSAPCCKFHTCKYCTKKIKVKREKVFHKQTKCSEVPNISQKSKLIFLCQVFCNFFFEAEPSHSVTIFNYFGQRRPILFFFLFQLPGSRSTKLYSKKPQSLCALLFLNDCQVFRKVGGALEDRVIKWFDYLWQNKVAPALLKIL